MIIRHWKCIYWHLLPVDDVGVICGVVGFPIDPVKRKKFHNMNFFISENKYRCT